MKQIINRYDNNNKLNLAFKRWGRITKKISCNENARIIQNFCRKIHDKYLKLKKEKNVPIYQTLSNRLIHLGKNPKRDFFDKLIVYATRTPAKQDNTGDSLQNALARYDRIYTRYTSSLSTQGDFLKTISGRGASQPLESTNSINFGIIGANSNVVVVIIVASMISLVAIGGYFFIRRRKKQY